MPEQQRSAQTCSTVDLLHHLSDSACVRAWKDEGWGPVHMKLLTTAMSLESQGFTNRSQGMTQNDKIIDHIQKNGSITQREALLDHSIQSLTKRIAELRADGWNIQHVSKIHPVTKQKYGKYYLPSTEVRAKAA